MKKAQKTYWYAVEKTKRVFLYETEPKREGDTWAGGSPLTLAPNILKRTWRNKPVKVKITYEIIE